MSWIKIRTNLATDPAVAAIGITTKMHPRQVVGCLVAVWCWADPLTADGFIAHATPKLINDISGKRGFADAMIGVQWLCAESGGIRFPKWDRHHSQSAKARAGESERKRISRQAAEMSAPPVPKMSGQTSGQVTEQSLDQIREDKRRGENTEETSSPSSSSPPPAPPDDQTDALPLDDGSPQRNPPVPFGEIIGSYNAHCTTMPRAELTEPRRKAIRARWNDRIQAKDANPIAWFETLFIKANASDFLSGRKGATDRVWRCNIDWLIGPKNAPKVMEGNYDNKTAGQPRRFDI